MLSADLLGAVALVAGAAASFCAAAPDAEPPLEASGRLVARIDCTTDMGPEAYFECGGTRLGEIDGQPYREAEGRPLARFGYRFAIDHIGRPHVAVIRYPDDKRRFMCIMDGTGYDLTTGVFTGLEQPLSGEMLTLRQVFWPRWTDCSIVFTTWSYGEPAAAASVDVYELPELPPIELPSSPSARPMREFGVQYEDPCGTGASEGAQTRDEWIDRVIAYMRHTGQDTLVYPLAWYHGPQFPSEREPSDGFDVVIGRDRKQYCRWTNRPADWYATLMDRMGHEGMGFVGSLTLLRLGSLLDGMNIDLEAIKGGAETYNNMRADDHVQAGTQDWTPQYNVINYPRLSGQAPADPRHLPWAYGERSGEPYGPGPMFSPLHPRTQEAVVGFVDEIARRYAPYPAFRGVQVNVWHATLIWFSSLQVGYDDYTVSLFERDTGVAVPVDPKAPDRFSQRYAFLTGGCRERWIAWRCQKVRDLVSRLRDTLRAARPDLRLTLTLWEEPSVPQILGFPGPASQIYARPSMAQIAREGGLDLDLLRDVDGLQIDMELGNARDRGGHGADPAGGTRLAAEHVCTYRDHDFLDEPMLDAMRTQPSPGAFVFNCWVEAWGEHRWFPCGPDDAQAAELAVMDGKPATGIFRINSVYPEDGFWWDSQLRITPPFPSGVHFLEPFAHAVAELDAQRLTRGGLFLDSAHGELTRRFVRAFRALPRQRFETVGDRTDPVAVRTLVEGSRRYLYLVNREYCPVTVAVRFGRPPERLLDLATREHVETGRLWRLTLGAYELRSVALPAACAVEGFETSIPPPIREELMRQSHRVLAGFARLRDSGHDVTGREPLEEGIRAAMAEGRFAWLRRALGSYPVLRCRELLGEPIG